MQKIVPADAILIPEQAQLMFKGIIYDTYQWQQQLFDGTETTFEMLRRADTVTTICVVNDKILVLRDEQPHRGLRLGFPGGRVDEDDETIDVAAKREVLEETGYTFDQWKLLKVWQPQRKMEWFVYLFVAWDDTESAKPTLDGGERITVDHMTFDEVKKLTQDKEGVLGESQDIFERCTTTDDILALPSFEGKSIG